MIPKHQISSFSSILLTFVLGIVLIAESCATKKKPESTNSESFHVSPKSTPKEISWTPTAETLHDMKHITLRLSFDYEKQHVIGNATLQLTPHFYSSNQVVLDAHHFILHRVSRVNDLDTISLKYQYDSLKLTIQLDREFNKNEPIKLFIAYTAQPNTIVNKGSRAISDSRGLYFINPTRADKQKPRQIWTQGEPESNSGWFPVIDKPNQKMTQEIYLTVDQNDKTLSNGELQWSTNHANGTRTDYWKQSLPHAPYLAMITVGDFVITKDFWRDSVAVDYYLEPKFAPYAKLIFGKTPKMMECFSQRLGVDYPWEKFSQVVVRDFVSGAMENTSAVIHYDAVQHDSRQHLDNPQEDIIAHELFHHWFGDLVTCESWNNISLNESFATYGEYMWHECEYGKNHADYQFTSNLSSYLRSRKKHDAPLFRSHYQNPNDVFDVVSYQKGSRVLHMLRNHVGDKAFFASLKLYLTQYRFQTAEIHNLRLAFEEVTGKDLNWFFNQWYFNAGHPDLVINHQLDTDRKKIKIRVEQKQDTNQYGVFRLPVVIEVHTQSQVKRYSVHINKSQQQFEFASDEAILFALVDADHVLLANIDEQKTFAMWNAQFFNTNAFLSKSAAMSGMVANMNETQLVYITEVAKAALVDTFFGTRELGLAIVDDLALMDKDNIAELIKQIATGDSEASNRAMAVNMLGETGNRNFKNTILKATNDSSYQVFGEAMKQLFVLDSIAAIKLANSYANSDINQIQLAVAKTYSLSPNPVYFDYFKNKLIGGNASWQFAREFSKYISIQNTETKMKGVELLKTIAKKNAMNQMIAADFFKTQKAIVSKQIQTIDEQIKSSGKDVNRKAQLENEKMNLQKLLDNIPTIQ
jgi:aminopeptidase N